MTKAKTQKSTVDSVGAQIGKKDYEDVSGTIAEIIAENRALKAQQAQEVDIIAVTKATYEFINNNGYNIQELVEFIINKSKDYLQQPDVCPNCKITLKFKKHGAVHKINQQPEKGNE